MPTDPLGKITRLDVRGVDLLEFAQGKITRKESFWKILE